MSFLLLIWVLTYLESNKVDGIDYMSILYGQRKIPHDTFFLWKVQIEFDQ